MSALLPDRCMSVGARHHFFGLRLAAIVAMYAFVLPAAADARQAQLLVSSNGESIALLVADVLSSGASGSDALQLRVRAEQSLTTASALREMSSAPPDGRTLLVMTSRTYEQEAAAAHTKVVARLAAVPYLLLAQPAKAQSWGELAQLSRRGDNALAIAVNGRDETARAGVTRLVQLGTLYVRPVAIKSASSALSAVLTRSADAAFEEAHIALPYVRGRRLAAVVTTSERRLPVIPAVAAASEIAPGYHLTKWIGVFAHADTPPAEVLKLGVELERLLRALPVRVTLTNIGLVTSSIDRDEFEQQVRLERTLTAGGVTAKPGQSVR